MKIVFFMLLAILLLFLMVANDYSEQVEGPQTAFGVRGLGQDAAPDTAVNLDGTSSAREDLSCLCFALT